MKTGVTSFLFILCLLITGCAVKRAPKIPMYVPKIFYLEVENVVIIDETAPADRHAPNQFVPSNLVPELQQWARDHFVAHGNQGRALVRIIDGRVTTLETNKAKEDREMQANVILSVEFIDTDPSLKGKVTVRATVSKNFSLAGWSTRRQKELHAFLRDRVFESIESQFYEQFSKFKLVKG